MRRIQRAKLALYDYLTERKREKNAEQDIRENSSTRNFMFIFFIIVLL